MILLLLIFSIDSHAADFPKWVDRPPVADRTYRYYVGRAVANSQEADGFREATRDAMESAIRENFGVVTSIQTSQLESLDSLALDKQTVEASGRIQLQEFEQIDSFVERSQARLSVFILFRYPYSAIAKEKSRIASGNGLAAVPLSEAGQMGFGGALKIQSVPQGAEVFIDDMRWGVTPVVIRGALKSGLHRLVIRHPRFDDISESVIVPPSGERLVSKILKPATSRLFIYTSPSQAQIVVDGKSVGHAPVKINQVPVGKRVLIVATFSDQNVLSRTLELKKGEDKEVHLDLPDETQEGADSKSSTDQVESESAPRALKSIFGLGLEYSGANIPKPFGQEMLAITVSYERRVWQRLGFRIKGGLDIGCDSSNSNDSSSSSTNESPGGFSYGIGVPIYLDRSDDALYLMPEVGGISYIFPASESEGSKEDISFVYQRQGISIGYQDPHSHFNVFATYYSYDWKTLGRHGVGMVGLSILIGK